jgi:hypothetical protein
MPQDIRVFSDHANCYAYAMKCQDPINHHIGGMAKPNGEVYTGDLDNYCNRLQAGVLADGGANVNLLRGPLDVVGFISGNIPAPRADWYLVAMLVNNVGFHFVRRQRRRFLRAPFWKWKQGNGGVIERNARLKNRDQWVRITNARFPDLITGQLITNGPGYAGWLKLYFFEVHYDGFQVTST